MARREFLQLAQTYDPAKDKIAGWYLSEKLDGTRCFWDGGLSRGVPTDQVPWAGITDPKTGLKKAKVKPVATGLWSRYGCPIIAPDQFLNLLPCVPLDGELWAGRGNFQLCRSICGGDSPDPRFMDQIVFAVYSSPPLPYIFGNGEIKNTNMVSTFRFDSIERWIDKRLGRTGQELMFLTEGATFDSELLALRDAFGCDKVYLHQQLKLPLDEEKAREQVDAELSKIVDRGGEGVIIRSPHAFWTPKRVRSLLKYKPFSDADGTVVGFTSGRLTNKGSKHLGKIGALILDYKGKRLELAGITDEEREFAELDMAQYAAEHPGIDMPNFFQGKHFQLGQEITFKHRDFTADGIPREARYWRHR